MKTNRSARIAGLSRHPRDDVTTSAITGPSGAVSELILKVTPPRAPRDLLVRRRLTSDDAQLSNRPVTVVQAPAGFGKTSLLVQWRREHLARGAGVRWVSAGAGHARRRPVVWVR